ncbi:hypothetical protein ACJMK2_031667 [Sinanodonta woodiana]|uniref:Uncharacterized protein n=1 Tax=Sinanodonta woodiana TaxID=1069815 RepID=A0ABD3WZG3_SINWO
MHAIAGHPFIIRTWPMIGSNVLITVKKDNNTMLDISVDEGIVRNSTVHNGRMMLICNQTTQQLCVLIENVIRDDEGIYDMKESLYKIGSGSDETEYDRKYISWNFKIYVLGMFNTERPIFVTY